MCWDVSSEHVGKQCIFLRIVAEHEFPFGCVLPSGRRRAPPPPVISNWFLLHTNERSLQAGIQPGTSKVWWVYIIQAFIYFELSHPVQDYLFLFSFVMALCITLFSESFFFFRDTSKLPNPSNHPSIFYYCFYCAQGREGLPEPIAAVLGQRQVGQVAAKSISRGNINGGEEGKETRRRSNCVSASLPRY